jgi:hypothetical protein
MFTINGNKESKKIAILQFTYFLVIKNRQNETERCNRFNNNFCEIFFNKFVEVVIKFNFYYSSFRRYIV